jgi:hypothetical protein
MKTHSRIFGLAIGATAISISTSEYTMLPHHWPWLLLAVFGGLVVGWLGISGRVTQLYETQIADLKDRLHEATEMLTGTRLKLSFVNPHVVVMGEPALTPFLDVTLQQMAIIARFGGYTDQTLEYVAGPIAVQYERILPTWSGTQQPSQPSQDLSPP